MSNLMIYRGTRVSDSAQALKAALVAAGFNVKLNRREGTPRLGQSWLCLNWGVSTEIPVAVHLNDPAHVNTAIDKYDAFIALAERGVSIPDFDEELGAPRRGKWLARTQLRGSGGEGIVVIREGDAVPQADLYVKYIPKLHEYRVHVFGGRAIAVQQKRKREGVEQSADEALIRNADNGWVFCVDNVVFPDGTEAGVKDEAVAAVSALGLDFGAVDIILGRDDNRPYVLEINTAPGLESPTVISAYVEAIGAVLRNEQ